MTSSNAVPTHGAPLLGEGRLAPPPRRSRRPGPPPVGRGDRRAAGPRRSHRRHADRAPTDTTFDALGVPAPLVEVLTASGIDSPFPIQVATLPDSLAGRDVLGRGRTGSGKTLAFSLPVARPRRVGQQAPAAAGRAADPGADPRAGQPGRRRRRPAGPRARHEDDDDLRRRRPEPAGLGARRRPRRRHRLPRPARGPHPARATATSAPSR